mmetsp:Transcript_31350/g.86188  ORF Transcript_31350/g.86188 Transcript_31350/m.86188 type:complete len:103 (-) Transcript_31350:2634-2942(-)
MTAAVRVCRPYAAPDCSADFFGQHVQTDADLAPSAAVTYLNFVEWAVFAAAIHSAAPAKTKKMGRYRSDCTTTETRWTVLDLQKMDLFAASSELSIRVFTSS